MGISKTNCNQSHTCPWPLIDLGWDGLCGHCSLADSMGLEGLHLSSEQLESRAVQLKLNQEKRMERYKEKNRGFHCLPDNYRTPYHTTFERHQRSARHAKNHPSSTSQISRSRKRSHDGTLLSDPTSLNRAQSMVLIHPLRLSSARVWIKTAIDAGGMPRIKSGCAVTVHQPVRSLGTPLSEVGVSGPDEGTVTV